MATAIKTFYAGTDSIIIPAGVKSVLVSTIAEWVSEDSIFTQGNNSYFLDPSGNILSAGAGGGGSLGDNTIFSKSSAVAIGGATLFSTVQFNKIYNQNAISKNGTIYSWGFGPGGYLGDGTIVTKSSPVAVVGNKKYSKIIPATKSLNGSFGLTTDGLIYYIGGTNGSGYAGTGAATTVSYSSPVAVVATNSNGIVRFVDGMANNLSVIAIDRSGGAWCWGDNKFGQLGNGTTVAKSSPVAVIGNRLFNKIYINTDFSFGFACALDHSGSAFSWGSNSLGELGDGTTVAKSSPVAVIGGHKFTSITNNTSFGVSNRSMYGLKSDRTLWCWGDNSIGQLGDGTTVAKSSPVAVIGDHKFTDVISTGATMLGIDTDNNMWSWGDGQYAALGDGTTVAKSSPVAVIGGYKWAKFLNKNSFGSPIFALTIDGAIMGWGMASEGVLSDGTTVNKSSPVAIVGVSGANVWPGYETRRITVTPGDSYNIVVGSVSMFGGTVISQNFADRMTVVFEQ